MSKLIISNISAVNHQKRNYFFPLLALTPKSAPFTFLSIKKQQETAAKKKHIFQKKRERERARPKSRSWVSRLTSSTLLPPFSLLLYFRVVLFIISLRSTFPLTCVLWGPTPEASRLKVGVREKRFRVEGSEGIWAKFGKKSGIYNKNCFISKQIFNF